MNRLLITGGAGFIGANLAVAFKERCADLAITCLDNLKRRGSELALARLRRHGIAFIHGDIRCPEDLEAVPPFEVLIDCSAEPSVQAGTHGSPLYVLQTNLTGTIHCLELARRRGAAFLFLSTSRVYPIALLNALDVVETPTRFELAEHQRIPGCSAAGVAEGFPLTGARSFYGAAKLAAELLIEEYAFSHGLPALVNRCGLVAGPWQWGKVDQGVVTYWVAQHVFQRPLRYLGFGGLGKQVRDVLHMDDLAELVWQQLQRRYSWDGRVYNVGGGRDVSFSLLELTELCRQLSGKRVAITPIAETVPTDVRLYLTDSARVRKDFAWRPIKTVGDLVKDVQEWIVSQRDALGEII